MNRQAKARLAWATTVVSAVTGGAALAAGYKIPEQSTNATALSAAYVANASGPDAAYYNPAAMVFNAPGAALQGNLTYLHLPSIDFTGTTFVSGAGLVSGSDSSREEDFVIPSFHYVSPAVGNARFGLSVAVPAGLTKRWDGLGRASAQEFTLKTVELNPSIGLRLSDTFSIGGGLRAIYSSGVVKSGSPAAASRDLEGDSIDFGYNLALHFRPTDRLSLAATYRSKVDLTVDGDATLQLIPVPAIQYSGGASVKVPVPAALALAAAFDVTPATTVELVYERTYWSSYKELDFNYDGTVPVQLQAFDAPLAKNWKDTTTYRLGLTHQLDDRWKLMAGFGLDEAPAPKRTIGFELPDSDGKIYSAGATYQASDKLNIGAAVLYADRDELTISAADGNVTATTGTFKDAGALLVTLGLEYRLE